jgi:hypothetical protein
MSFVSFPLAMILSVFVSFPLAIIMAKGKLTKTDNIMDKGKLTKDRPHHGQRETDKRQSMSFVSFPLAMILSVFFQLPFGHDIVCLLSASLCP